MQRIESNLANKKYVKSIFIRIDQRVIGTIRGFGREVRKISEVFPVGHQVAALATDKATGSKL